MKNKYLFTISAGHFFTDMNNGALLAMLPFIAAAGGLNYAQIAGLTFASSLSSSLTQPLFGFIADKMPKIRFLPFGVLLAGCGVALVGILSGYYWMMFGAALIAGIGTAAYHPEGARLVNSISGEKKGSSMGLFTVGGAMGVAAGPLIVTPAMVHFGLPGSAVLLVPAIAMCVVIFIIYPGIRRFAEITAKDAKETEEELQNEWGKFLWLSIAIASRSIVAHSMNTFLPLYWVNVLQQSKAAGGMVISFVTFIGAIAILSGGFIADRFGFTKIIRTGWIVLFPSILLISSVTTPALSILALFPFAIGCYMINTPMVVLGQQFLPKSVGFASGITLGLGVSVGGVVTPFLGRFADIYGLVPTLKLLCIFPVIGTIVSFTTKAPRRKTL